MNLFARINNVLHIDPNRKKENSLPENGGVFMMLAGIYGVPLYYSIIILTMLLFHTSMIVYTLYYIVMYIIEDLEFLAETLHFTIVYIWDDTFLIVPHIERKHYNYIIRALKEGVYKYKTLDPETQKLYDELTQKMFRRKMFRSRVMLLLYSMGGVSCLVIFPILGGKLNKPKNDDGLLRQALVAYAWWPHDYSGWIGWSFTLINQCILGIIFLFIPNGTDIPFICYSEELLCELALLNLTLQNTTRRAKYLFWKRYGENPEESLRDRRYSLCVQACLKETILHHYAINRFFNALRSAYRKTLIVVFVSSGLSLCMSGAIFYSSRFSMGIKLAFMIYLSGEITHIFLFSHYGQSISQLSADVRESSYKMDWIDCSRDVRPYLTMLQLFLNKELKLTTSGGFFTCNYETFGNIISTAYSYFNLLLAAVDF